MSVQKKIFQGIHSLFWLYFIESRAKQVIHVLLTPTLRKNVSASFSKYFQSLLKRLVVHRVVLFQPLMYTRLSTKIAVVLCTCAGFLAFFYLDK